MIDQRIIDAFRETQACDARIILQAPSEPSDPWSAPLSFRDFLRLKKEVLEAYSAWQWAKDYWPVTEEIMRTHQITAEEASEYHRAVCGERLPTDPPSECWPEALQGLTREEIEILKL